VHDFNGGILPSGLFWTLDMRRSRVDFHRSGRRAVLTVRDLAVVDSFQFFGPSDTPALVDFRVEWNATGPAVARGLGTAVPATDPGAWLGDVAPAVSTASISGAEIGFEFETRRDATSADGGYAQIGRNRNGSFLR
jgi:hypothetical protein